MSEMGKEMGMKTGGNKVVYFGLGLWDLLKEKTETLFSEVAKRGERRKNEDLGAAETGAEQSEPDQGVFWSKAEAFIRKTISGMGLARAANLTELEQRVVALEETVRSFQQQGESDE